MNQKKNSKVVNIQEVEELSTYDTYNEILVEEVLRELEEDLKIVTVLYYYDDISVKDISTMLEIPEGTVKSRLSRAREKLYQIFHVFRSENQQNPYIQPCFCQQIRLFRYFE